MKKTNTDEKQLGETPQEIVDAVTKLDNQEQQQVIAKLDMYAGPIPHPDILARYEELDPGAAKKIIDNGVEESVHRRELEDKSMEYTRSDKRRRDWMGFIIGILGMAFSALLLHEGHPVVGSLFAGGSLVVLVGMFLGESKASVTNEDEQDKEKQ